MLQLQKMLLPVILLLYKSMKGWVIMSLGNGIRKIRQEKKISLRKLAEIIQSDPSYISRIETDQQNPSIHTLDRIASALGCEVPDFFGTKEEVPEELKGKVEWLTFAEEMEDKKLTPEELRKIIEVFEMMKGKG
jgi:transcriptional regulator with XRE-family HTH domain